MDCPVDTRLAPHVGLCKPIRAPKHLVLHLPSGCSVDPREGTVYGSAATPVGFVCSAGYVRIGTRRDGHQYAHRLIYEACRGPIPPGYYIDHVNGCKADNRLRNLEAVTPSENLARAYERGALPIGAAKLNARLTEALVRKIRASRVPTREWARQLDLDPSTVRAARAGTTWRHVPCRGRVPAKPRWRRPK